MHLINLIPAVLAVTTATAQDTPDRQTEPAWRSIASDGAPCARSASSVVWTGREAIVFGGIADERHLGDAAAYDPAKDRWRALPLENAPSPRAYHSAVWTGRVMILWGGDGPNGERFDGAAYDPKQDRWRPLTLQGAPAARASHAAVWTGTHMFIWAGVDERRSFPNGALYDPLGDAWQRVRIDIDEPTPRTLTGTWTGKHALFWGGINGSSVLGHGLAFDPATGDAQSLPRDGAPSPRAFHGAIWTGRDLVIWGGSRSVLGGRAIGDGARLDPQARRWHKLPTRGAPLARFGHAAVWTGSEMLVIGGATKRDRTPRRDVFAWHPERGWRELAPLPRGRVHAHAFQTQRGTLVIGGRNAAGGFLLPTRAAQKH